ncbi:hypothetical protein WHR41_07406 [Cladosporium halotolerans]|uniref:Uncharacterized protein n=1 Tax=Cladosporium halotolerans TaxID=1052096 RepID=A0AB34KIW9_9PEZI
MKPTRVEVPFWPTSPANLSWSADNLIAVGGGESVAILVPQLDPKAPNGIAWDQIVQRVSLFTQEDIPFHTPFTSANWSLGEELSLRHVTSLAWSGPGLAQFGTCALAILHSNHALVLWECVGRPQVKDSWKRCLVVNHAIRTYYQTNNTGDFEMTEVKQRIRAFTWLPAVQKNHRTVFRGIDPHLERREHFLVVSTDGGDIFTLRVSSPYDILNPEKRRWEVEIAHRLEVSQTDVEWRPCDNGNIELPGAVDLACSDWDDAGQAKFAYLVKGRLYFCKAHYEEFAEIGVRVVMSQPQESILSLTPALKGPLRFAPNSNSIYVFGPDAIINVDLENDMSHEAQIHHLDGRWDEISGLTFTANAGGTHDLQLVSHISSASSGTSRLPLSLEDTLDSKEPDWLQAIQGSKATFSASYDLGSYVQERTWGIAASQLGDFVATCVSLLPGDSPAHFIQSEQRSVVTITPEYRDENSPFPINGGRSPPQDISAESLMFELRQYFSRNEELDKNAENKETIRHLLLKILGLSDDDLSALSDMASPYEDEEMSDSIIDSQTLDGYLCYLKARCLYDPSMFFQRVDHLLDIVAQRPPKLQLTKEDYNHLVTTVLALPTRLHEVGALSSKISAAYKAVKAKFDSSGSAVDPAMTDSATLTETCKICERDIELESLKWSRCASGHQFSRCCLTFLSIMEPGITKSCGICQAVYLNENVLPGLKGASAGEAQTEDDPSKTGGHAESSMNNGSGHPNSRHAVAQIEPIASLARLIFAACDKCIFCGGKFVA